MTYLFSKNECLDIIEKVGLSGSRSSNGLQLKDHIFVSGSASEFPTLFEPPQLLIRITVKLY
jgi:hypothetical protein